MRRVIYWLQVSYSRTYLPEDKEVGPDREAKAYSFYHIPLYRMRRYAIENQASGG